MHKNKQGFSLLELSIVITIIAIISAGIFAGDKFVHSSRLNKLIAEINNNLTALKTFKTTHGYWPGDLPDAEDIWGSSNVDNGNGDGFITGSSEYHNVGVQLVKENLIKDKSYARSNASYALQYDSFDGLKSAVFYQDPGVSGFNYSSLNRNRFQIGGGYHGFDAFFIPKDAHAIDVKLDDGKPRSGTIFYRIFGTTTDASCTNSTTSYYLSSNIPGCNIIYEFE